MSAKRIFNAMLLPLLCFALASCEGSGGSSSGNGSTQTGIGGSTARMTIQGDYLYAIAGSNVQLFDISTASAPVPWVNVPVAWDIETLFPHREYLLIGGQSGMHIMDNTDPGAPYYLSEFSHARARDPVVATYGFAYVTLKSDGFSTANQMDVISIGDMNNPSLVKTLPMQSPSGLSLEGNKLFVCDGVAGLKIFDISDPAAPDFSESINGVNCNDVIVKDDVIYVITTDALLQYDVSVSPPVLLSSVQEQ